MSELLWFTDDELGGGVQFENDERVRLLIEDIEENVTYKKLTVKTRVLSENNKGKLFTDSMFKYLPDGKTLNPNYKAFVFAFYTADEIKEKKALMGKLQGRIYSATVKRTPGKKDPTKVFQNLGNFKDEGMSPSTGADIGF